MGDPQQVVWDDEQKAAPAAAPSSAKVQWDDAGQAKPATAAPRVSASPSSIAPPSGTDWLMHPFKSAGQSIDIASQYYGAKGDKDESIAKGVGKSLGRTATMIPSIAAHPYDALVGGNLELKKRADEEAAQGRTSESMLHSIAAGVPLFGPMAVGVGERLGGTRTEAPTKSDIAGGLTDLATAALMSRTPAGKGVKSIAEDVTGAGPSVGEAVSGVREAINNPKQTYQNAAAVAKPAIAGAVEDIPVVRGAVKAVRAAKAAKAAQVAADARAADYNLTQEQGELARTGAKDVPSNRDVPVSTEGRPAGFPDRLTERITPDGKSEILGPDNKPFIGERSTRLSESEIADRAAKRGMSVDEFKQALRQPKQTPNIAQPQATAPETTPNISQQWTEPGFDEITSGIKRVGRAGESKAAQASYGDAEHHSIGQFAKVNGPRIDAALPDTPEGQTLANHIHSMTANDIKAVAKRIDIEPEYKEGKGGKQVLDRPATFNKILDAGKSPEDIVNSHYSRLANPPSVGGGAPDISDPNFQVRQRLADPNVRAENTIGNMMMVDKYATGERLPSRITELNDLANRVKTVSSPEELQELDRIGQNKYNEVKTNIAKTYQAESKAAPKPNIAETAVKPNIAEAPQDVKVWRDTSGEQHPVRLKYEYGQPVEADGRHRVIEAFKNGYDRIEITVDKGKGAGAQKMTLPIQTAMKEFGVTPESLKATDAQQTSIRAGGGKPRISIKK
jgi:hypothetical protein